MVTMSDVLALPGPLREAATWMLRRGEVGVDDLARQFGGDSAEAERMIQSLVTDGFVEVTHVNGAARYAIKLASKPPAPQRARGRVDHWKALDGL